MLTCRHCHLEIRSHGYIVIWDNDLTHWGQYKMAAISQTRFSNAFSWMKRFEFSFKLHWIFFNGSVNYKSALVQTMAWCRSAYICVTRPQWVKSFSSLLPYLIPSYQNMNVIWIVWWIFIKMNICCRSTECVWKCIVLWEIGCIKVDGFTCLHLIAVTTVYWTFYQNKYVLSLDKMRLKMVYAMGKRV